MTRDYIDGLRSDIRKAQKSADMANVNAETMLKDNVQLSRSLAHERKMREDMQNGVQAAKESLAQIRKLHWCFSDRVPTSCMHCQHPWPCPTVQAIREPEQLVITSLLILQHELEQSTGDK